MLPPPTEIHAPYVDLSLLNELRTMFNDDQKICRQIVKNHGVNLTEEDLNLLKKVSTEHQLRLKVIVEKFGWPGYRLVGEEGSHCMWLLVQHCDQDLEFQKECLELLTKAVADNNASKEDLAYLTDRILTHEGKDQIYGTQFEKNSTMPCRIHDPENLDKRRQEMGLIPFSEYVEVFKRITSN